MYILDLVDPSWNNVLNFKLPKTLSNKCEVEK